MVGNLVGMVIAEPVHSFGDTSGAWDLVVVGIPEDMVAAEAFHT